jgi:hypothetical protein
MIKLPQNWSQVTIEQFIEFSTIDREQGAYHYNSEALSILSDEPMEVIEDMDVDDMAELVAEAKWCTSEPSKRYINEVLGMKFKPLSKLTLYEYIDLDYFFTDNYVTNLDKVCAICYRHSKVNEWGNEILEPYEFDCNLRAERFHDLPITDVYGIINEFLKYRDTFLKNYENLFSGELDEDLTHEERRELDPEEVKEIEQEQKIAKWSWEQTIYGLTNGDITKSEKVGALPLIYVFNTLAMKKELDI